MNDIEIQELRDSIESLRRAVRHAKHRNEVALYNAKYTADNLSEATCDIEAISSAVERMLIDEQKKDE